MPAKALEWDDYLGLAIPLLAAIPFFIALRAWRRTRTTRVLLFASAFGVFFLKAVIIGAQVFATDYEAALDAAELLADAAVLLLFFLGMAKG